MLLKGKTAIVTGSSRGIGKDIALALAGAGAKVVINYLENEKSARKVLKEIEALGGVALAIKADVSSVSEAELLVEEAVQFFGRLDILVNNAGGSRNAGVLDMTDEDWEFTINTDLTSVFKVTRAFGKYMVERRYGRIINIASIFGQVGNTAINTIAYHTAKGGVVNFTRAVAAELAKYNITCNAISPGYFETELTKDTLDTEEFTQFMKATVPLGRYGREGELNAAAIFLASDEASYITGQNIKVDGGYTSV